MPIPSAFDPFKQVVSSMMNRYGTTALVEVQTQGDYDVDTSTYSTASIFYPVKAIALDLTKDRNGLREGNTNLIQEGDKQIFIQPSGDIPRLQPNRDKIHISDKIYKIHSLKEVNTTLTSTDLVVYEAICRE